MKISLQTFLDKYIVATSHEEAKDDFVDLVVEILGDYEDFNIEEEPTSDPDYYNPLVRNELKETQIKRLEDICNTD